MIEISTTAQRYFRNLIEKQDLPDLGLRITVIDPGTPRASCDLQFCPADEREATDQSVEFTHFNLYVAQDSASWLEEATIDFEEDGTGGQLSIRAPNIKGSMPANDADLGEHVVPSGGRRPAIHAAGEPVEGHLGADGDEDHSTAPS